MAQITPTLMRSPEAFDPLSTMLNASTNPYRQNYDSDCLHITTESGRVL